MYTLSRFTIPVCLGTGHGLNDLNGRHFFSYRLYVSGMYVMRPIDHYRGSNHYAHAHVRKASYAEAGEWFERRPGFASTA